MKIPPEQVSPYLSRLVGVRAVCDRYSISLRTIDRWLSRKIIPPPDRVINSRRYWYLDNLERADRQHVLNAAANVTAAQ